MNVHSDTLQFDSRGFTDIHDLTAPVESFLQQAAQSEGLLCVSVPGSTAGITTIEYESGALEDFKAAIERLAPRVIGYAHGRRWGDGNGFSHVRAAMLGPSISIPVSEGKARLGTWQQIILVDFDNRPRTRTVLLQLIGSDS